MLDMNTSRLQRGGTFLGFILGLVIGLAVALGVAMYVTKVPTPFSNKNQTRSPEQDVALSVVSLWEIVIKQQTGRLPLPASAWEYMTTQRDRHGIANTSPAA